MTVPTTYRIARNAGGEACVGPIQEANAEFLSVDERGVLCWKALGDCATPVEMFQTHSRLIADAVARTFVEKGRDVRVTQHAEVYVPRFLGAKYIAQAVAEGNADRLRARITALEKAG